MQIITNEFQKELKEHGVYQFPILVIYETLSLYESGSFLWHWHPEIELTFLISGEMIYKVNHNSYHLRKGDALFGNINTLHAGSMFQNKDCHYVSITFDPKIIYGYEKSLICQKYVEPIIQDFSLSAVHLNRTQLWHSDILESIADILYLDVEKMTGYELEIIIELQKIWNSLFQNMDHDIAYTAHEKNEYERIKGIMTYIQQNYGEKISLSDISSHIHLCTSECSRLFKRYMHISLFSFLQEYRIEKSLEFLSDEACPITEAAARAGFTDSNYYAKIFSKYKGCSPRSYRKQVRQLRPHAVIPPE